MRKIIITDLTRFNNPEKICTAGVDVDTGRLIRPMPYLPTADCLRLGLLPGSILSGEFTPQKSLKGPHQEDVDYKNLKFVGPCSSQEFEQALRSGLQSSVSAGFELELGPGQKYVPPQHTVGRSIITIEVAPDAIEIVNDGYKPGKVKVHFTDASGRQFSYMSITDLGFFRYAATHRATDSLDKLNGFISRQELVYLRVGLSRPWSNGAVEACWMQVNGIYTFPDFFKDIRSYK